MEHLGLNEIRKQFLDFYASKGHYVGRSSSLIPKNDKSILIINSQKEDVHLPEVHPYR